MAGTISVDSATTTSIVVSSSNTPSWKATFRSDLGGILSSLVVPSSSSTNLIETSKTTNTLYGMGLVVRDINTMFCDENAEMHMLESSSVRTIISVSGSLFDYTNGACGTTKDGNYSQVYTIYPDRIIVKGEFSSDTAGTGVTGPYIAFGANHFDDNAYISDDNTAPSTISTSTESRAVTDISYADPGISLTLTGSDAASITNNDYQIHSIEVPSFFVSNKIWYQNDAIYDKAGFISDDELSGGQNYNYAYVFKITNDNTTDGSEAKISAQDYWHPDNLNADIFSGQFWDSSIEFTDVGNSDYFNQYQGYYPFISVPNILGFKFSGGTYKRISPVFKIRNWRRDSMPTAFSVEGSTKTLSSDYNANFIPFSEAWLYNSTGTWKQIAKAGLTSDSEEYLADTNDNTNFDQGSYQIFDNSNDYLYLGSHSQFTGFNSTLATRGSGSDLVTSWTYCSANLDINTPCDTWTGLSISNTNSGVSSFVNSGNAYFTLPNNWTKATANSGSPLYYIRVNKTAGSYSTYPIERSIFPDIIITQYLSSITSDNQTFDIYNKPTPSMTFLVDGVESGVTTNGITTNIASQYNTLPFGSLAVAAPKYIAHQLKVINNADSGYSVTMKLVNTLQGNYPVNNIDEFAASSVSWTNPQNWSSPDGVIKNINTGWIGANTSDIRVNGWSDASGKYGPVNTISHQVMTSSEPETEEKAIYVTYAIEANYLQPSDLYAGTLIYNILPQY